VYVTTAEPAFFAVFATPRTNGDHIARVLDAKHGPLSLQRHKKLCYLASLGLSIATGRGVMVFWRKRRAVQPRPESAHPRPESVAWEAAQPSVPSTHNTAAEIDVIREQGGSFQVRSANSVVVYLRAAEAVQVHRYLSPYKKCACSCASEEGVLVSPTQLVERDGKLSFETRTNAPGCQVFEVNSNLVALRDNKNTTLALDVSACRKLHFLLRPGSCQCGCLIDASAYAVQRRGRR
jgi:hypothetical protein